MKYVLIFYFVLDTLVEIDFIKSISGNNAQFFFTSSFNMYLATEQNETTALLAMIETNFPC